jgi:alkaline phosphatase D
VHAFADIHHAQGEMAGEVTATSVLLQSRLTAIPGSVLDESGAVPGKEGVACFEWSESADFAQPTRSKWSEAKADHDFIIRSGASGLKPGTLYHYRLVFGETRETAKPGPTRSFKTLSESGPVSFCMGSCMNYHSFMIRQIQRRRAGHGDGGGQAARLSGLRGHDGLEARFLHRHRRHRLLRPSREARCQTLPELRRKWHEQFRFPRLIEFFARTPRHTGPRMITTSASTTPISAVKGCPAPTTGIEIFREQMPIFDAADRETPTYRTHRVHKHLQLWFVEGRDFRSPNKMPDGPEKSIWGREQREWLQTHAQSQRRDLESHHHAHAHGRPGS